MKHQIVFVTGTDTGIGKTAVASLLTRFLRECGVSVAALKPICSGGRSDARMLRAAAGEALTLDEINPWHFRAPVSPSLAAQQEGNPVSLRKVIAHIKSLSARFHVAIVEGAGGLLSPLGENFDSRDLMMALHATPVIVCPNRLGAINQVRLVLAALPRATSRRAQVVLVAQPKPEPASRSNASVLSEWIGRERIHVLPWIKPSLNFKLALKIHDVRKAIEPLTATLGINPSK